MVNVYTDSGGIYIRGIDQASSGLPEDSSTAFEVRKEDSKSVFSGKGSDTGAWPCQGSSVMADEGKGYREILEHYYPGTVPGNINTPQPTGRNYFKC
jgi:peptidoglycan hydrolase-like amidase